VQAKNYEISEVAEYVVAYVWVDQQDTFWKAGVVV
jgi:hypothetical protein